MSDTEDTEPGEVVMRAVVVVGGQNRDGFPPADRCPAPLLWLVDRPVVQHVCEALVGRGVTSIDWVHCRPADATRRFLGNGERWGGRFTHQAADDMVEAYALAQVAVAAGPAGPVLFGHADRVPADLPSAADGPAGAVYGRSVDAGWVWTGWAALAAGQPLPAADDEGELLARLQAAGVRRVNIAPPLAVRSFAGYLAATHAALARQGGVVVSRRARVHPTATLVGPVHIGPDAVVGAGAAVGPFVAVGPNCVIDRGVQLSHTAVLPDTYVGGRLDLGRAVVDRNRVVHLGAGGDARLTLGLPVGDLSGHPLTGLTPALARRAARLVRRLARLGRA